MAAHRTRWLVGTACVIAAALAATAVLLLTGGETAPKASAMPLTSGDRIIAQRAGGSTVASGLPDRYRYMAMAGQVGDSRGSLILGEVATMRRHGWTVRESSRADPTTLATAEIRFVHVPIDAHGAGVVLEDARREVFASLETVGSVHEANDINLVPMFNPEIGRALQRHRPVLIVTLGHNPHSRR